MLSNYQIGKIIAKRKIKEKIKNKSPLDLVKQQLSLGIDTGNNYIDEHLGKLNEDDLKVLIQKKYLETSERMFITVSNKQYSYFLGVSQAFGHFIYTGHKLKL